MDIKKTKCDHCGKMIDDRAFEKDWITISSGITTGSITVRDGRSQDGEALLKKHQTIFPGHSLDFCSPECLLSFLGFTKEEKKPEKHSMSVDFNNLRIQMVKSYNRLICRMRHGRPDFNKSRILVNVEDILPALNELRECIATLACCYREGDENFKNIADKLPEILSLEDE